MSILNNLDIAIQAVTDQPEKLFDLASYICKTECGTLYCTAGVLAQHPHFQALGWTLACGLVGIRSTQGTLSLQQGADSHLGEDAWNRLLAPRGEGVWDQIYMTKPISDKGLALARLKAQGAIYARNP
jgi:hypothetical protein